MKVNTYVAKFRDLALAQSFAYRCTKTMMIVLGDDELFWVTTFAGAQRFVNQGYELAQW
jgi:hypothetical protein